MLKLKGRYSKRQKERSDFRRFKPEQLTALLSMPPSKCLSVPLISLHDEERQNGRDQTPDQRNDNRGASDGQPKESNIIQGQLSEGYKVLTYHGSLVYETKRKSVLVESTYASLDDKLEHAALIHKDDDGRTSDGQPKNNDILGGHISKDDKILASHGPLIYEVKVENVAIQNSCTDSSLDDKLENAHSVQKEDHGGTNDEQPKENDTIKGQFNEGDKVLVYLDPLIYEAKGQSNSLDEGVGANQLMEFSNANLDLQKKLLKDHNVDRESKSNVVQDKQKTSTGTEGIEYRSKSFSTGALELKAKPLAIGGLNSSFQRKKGKHVSLSVLERMENDPILAQHFAQLVNPSISEFVDGSKRLLSTTNHLRRTTDSVGLKYVNQYIVIKILGCGTYGKVKLCLNTMDCKLYAVKIVHRKWLTKQSIVGTTENVGHGAMREIAIMKKLNHPHIVALHEVIDDPSKKKLYLVLEYVEGGPIMSNEEWHPFSEDKACLYFRDMCKGLDYLHFNKIVHRDLKPGNLLQTLDGKIKISDFGVSHMFEQESDSMHDIAGTPAFLAPEVCSGGECQGRPADLWSLGVCLYVMVFGKIPFPADSIAKMYQAIMHEELAFSSKIKISKDLKHLLTLILTKDPSMRISLAGIMQHDWVTKEGTEPLVPYKVQVARGSTIMSVTEDEVKTAIGVNKKGLAALCKVNPIEKIFEEGEYIIRQGDEGNEMYFINNGQCEVLVESRSLTQPSRGRMEYAVAERGPGQYIGEMELQKDPRRKPPRRNTSIRAKTRVVALVVSREQVMDVLSKNAEAAQSMAETIAERDRELQIKLRALDLSVTNARPEKDEEEVPQLQETCTSCRCF